MRELADYDRDYQQILIAWGDLAKDRERVVENLVRLESSMGQLPTCVELEVVFEIAEREPTALLPLAKLHAEAVSSYLGRARPDLADHSLIMVERILLRYSRKSMSEDAGYVAATGLSAAIASVEDWRSADLLRRLATTIEFALAMDSDHLAALAIAADVYEKLGEVDKAVSILTRLIPVAESDADRAKLSLALNRLRLSPLSIEARNGLMVLAESASEEWIRRLAALELVRLEPAEEDVDAWPRGIESLKQQFPRDCQADLLAVARAEEGSLMRRNAVSDLVADLETSEHCAPSARALYDRGPRAEATRAHEEFSVRASESSEDLARVARALPRRPRAGLLAPRRDCVELLEILPPGWKVRR